MNKIVSLVKRQAGLSVAEFQRYWQETHAPIAAQLPGLKRYSLSLPLAQGYRKGELLFDGMSEMWFDSYPAYLGALGSPDAVAMAHDQGNFMDRNATVIMPVDIHVIKDGAIPADAVKNIEFVNQRPGMDRDAFRHHWREIHGPIASKIEAVQRYEQNHLSLEEYARDSRPRFDGLAITWFDSTAAMRQGATTPEYAVTRADEPNFLPDGHLPIIITKEVVVIS
ncbi:hypothetical protein CR155_18565 [Pollutimonas nitritireducens]|uniref:EthD domain-containing protein n=1 Tax=Pollutimonas nitritireducens TaxID=2045209 RepID=A0A2N4UB71_9BURK|nr:EthD family reductase [Pollutimonas nitritireducens]PLC52260.1 hypothetical protein CR155_18565 [Pollutimonas nitritireducens]